MLAESDTTLREDLLNEVPLEMEESGPKRRPQSRGTLLPETVLLFVSSMLTYIFSRLWSA